MPDAEAIDAWLTEVLWGVVYALPWVGALALGGWSWQRLRPRSMFLAWAAATPIALGSLVFFAVALVSVVDVLAPPVPLR